MEAKLKALKVVDLKDILAKARVTVQGKANKQDLIAKIIASPAALQVYDQQRAQPTSKPAPVAPVADSTPSQPHTDATEPDVSVADTLETRHTLSTLDSPQTTTNGIPPSPPTSRHPVPQPTLPATAPPPPVTVLPSAITEDEELEKRKARAARFNVPLVEPTTKPKAQPSAAAAIDKPLADDPEKLSARAARFGIVAPSAPAATATSASNGASKPRRGNKRPAPPAEPADAEELERRRKRAERFGTAFAGTTKA